MKTEIRTIIVEAAIVVIAGLGIGLAANQLSPRGLALSRNYFPMGTNQVSPARAPVQVVPAPAETNEPSEAALLSERLLEKGLQGLEQSRVETLFHDPRCRDGRVVFIDARDEDNYQEGHVPGAYELDPYHPDKKLATVLLVCQAAEQIVVYCTGGDCEDSDSAAILLRDAGVPGPKIFVFAGGFTAWQAARFPVEIGARNSGIKSK